MSACQLANLQAGVSRFKCHARALGGRTGDSRERHSREHGVKICDHVKSQAFHVCDFPTIKWCKYKRRILIPVPHCTTLRGGPPTKSLDTFRKRTRSWENSKNSDNDSAGK